MTIGLKQSLLGGAFVLFASVAGCSVSATTGPGADTCSMDTNVTGCSGGATGYSCTGAETPAQSITGVSCSSGIVGGNGLSLFCCISSTGFTTGTCAQDGTVTGCVTPSIGFSCTGSNTPQQTDTSLACSTGVASASGAMNFCCNTAGVAPVPTACAADSNIPCSTGTGYACPTGIMPDATMLSCGMPGVTEPNGETGYCCSPPTTTTTACAADTAVTCTAPATGYSCPSGVASPASATVTCGAGVAEANGEMGYCCGAATTVTTTCSTNTSVTCASSAETGYSCTGTDTPWQATPTLICETMVVNGANDYCCVNSANACAQAPTITDCPAMSFGVACTGGAMAGAASAGLICGADPGASAGGFCCTTN